MKKVKGEKDRRIIRIESDQDKWKEKADKLSSDSQTLKSSMLEKKASAIDQLFL